MIHMYTGKILNALITETPDAYLRLQVTRYVFVEILRSLLLIVDKPVIVAFIASRSGWDCPSVYMRSMSDVFPFSRSTGGSLISNRLTYANTGVELNTPSLTWKLMALVTPLN